VRKAFCFPAVAFLILPGGGEPQRIICYNGKPEAFHTDCGKAAATFSGRLSFQFQHMPDLLVNLLKLPSFEPLTDAVIRRAQPFELTQVRTFIASAFAESWADEVSVGFANKPVSVYLATIDRRIVGFAAYECTRRGFFGPTGVATEARGKGIGKALLLASLLSLREMGYVYAIIGAAGPVRFYQETVGAIVIPDSEPGIYTDLLRRD